VRAELLRLVEKGLGFGERQVDERVVCRRALDVAALAGEVAERARIQPQRLEMAEPDRSAALALRRDERVAELRRVDRARGCIAEGRGENGSQGGDRRSPFVGIGEA
jgi:hypothetical protein